MSSREEERQDQNSSENQEDSQKFWRLTNTYERPHIEILKVLYGQEQHALVTSEVYRKTQGLDISDRQKRNIFQELDEDDLLDYVTGNPAFLAKKDFLEDTVKDLIEAWNEANRV